METMPKPAIDAHTIAIVPRYSETDQAGVVHHTVYPVWFEMGRTELLRVNGFVYRDLEKAGIYFVVTELSLRYRRPALYDEQLDLTTKYTKITTTRVEHAYTLKRRDTGLILAEGTSTLACLDADAKLRRVPQSMFPPDTKARINEKKIQPSQ